MILLSPLTDRPGFGGWILLRLVLYILIIAVVGPFALVFRLGIVVWVRLKYRLTLLELWSREKRHFRKPLTLLIMLSFLGLILVFAGNRVFLLELQHKELLRALFLSILLTPLGIVLTELEERVSMFLKPRSVPEIIEQLEEQRAKRERASEERARHMGEENPAYGGGGLYLGVVEKSRDVPTLAIDKDLGLSEQGRLFMIDEKLINQHFMLVGVTGVGKTETLKRLVYEIAAKTNRDIFFVDGKGEGPLAQEIRNIVYTCRGHEMPVFRLGRGQKGYPHNGFVGTPEAIYGRLSAVLGVQELGGEATVYGNVMRRLLQLICDAPCGPPRSFEDVLERIDLDWLKKHWAGITEGMRTINRLEKVGRDGRLTEGFYWNVEALAVVLKKVVNENGFALEDSGGAIFSIRTPSLPDTSARYLDFLIEDFKDFFGNRQVRPAVLIIDEFAAFKNENIVALFQMARSSELGVILSTTDLSSLPDLRLAEEVLANSGTHIVMRCKYPEKIIELAGTVMKPEASYHWDELGQTNEGSVRLQHQFAIDPNEVRALRTGECFVARMQSNAKVAVTRVDEQMLKQAPPEVLPPEPIRSQIELKANKPSKNFSSRSKKKKKSQATNMIDKVAAEEAEKVDREETYETDLEKAMRSMLPPEDRDR